LGASTHEITKCETRGGESEPLNPGTGGPLDQNSVEISYTGSSGVRRLEGATFDRRSHEVPRDEARENTWYIHQVGPAWTRVAWEGVNIMLTSRISEVHEAGARRIDAPTREVARCETYEKEVKPSLTFVSQRFMR
jgi:hypothetical protein